MLSLGAFDYGRALNPLAPAKLDGYTVELRIDQLVAERGLPTVARTMVGVGHRTKRDKLGRREGLRRTGAMSRDLLTTVWPFGDVRPRTCRRYLRALTIERPPAV